MNSRERLADLYRLAAAVEDQRRALPELNDPAADADCDDLAERVWRRIRELEARIGAAPGRWR